jgi:hypothetical protein
MTGKTRFLCSGRQFAQWRDPICWQCQHFTPPGSRCKAFPGGIPGDILTSKVDHRNAFPGDNGLRFEPKQG